MSNRTGGSSPIDPSRGSNQPQDPHRKIEKIEKIRPVDEAENERARKKFQHLMEEKDRSIQAKRKPTPMEAEFHLPNVVSKAISSLEDLKDSLEMGSSDSSPSETSLSSENAEESSPLPQSHDFWSHVDAPADQPPHPIDYKETQDSMSRLPPSKEAAKKRQGEKENRPVAKEQKSDSLYGPPGKTGKSEKPLSEKESVTPAAKGAQKKKPPLSSIEEQVGPASFEEEKKRMKSEERQEKEEETGKALFSPPPSRQESPSFGEMQKEKENDRGTKDAIAIEASSLSSLPDPIASIAQAAATAATPYLSPEILPLFHQMVGTIHYMIDSTPGISKTEILLNSPSFANSKFFGVVISIEKYATAPNSLNIRLTGTDTAAVRAFQQNIPNLYAAFEKGNFNFEIGRISAEYSTERPMFRRKDSGQRRENGSGGDENDQRGKR